MQPRKRRQQSQNGPERPVEKMNSLKLDQPVVVSIVLSVVFGILQMLPAQANSGVPTIAVIWPVSWYLLLLIIPLEAQVAVKVLKVDFVAAVCLSARANIVSTLVGIPIAWALLAAIEMLVWQRLPHTGISSTFWLQHAFTDGAWIMPLWDAPKWYAPTALCLLNIPFCLMSVYVERWIINKQREHEITALMATKWAWEANLLSYTLLTAGTILLFALGICYL